MVIFGPSVFLFFGHLFFINSAVWIRPNGLTSLRHIFGTKKKHKHQQNKTCLQQFSKPVEQVHLPIRFLGKQFQKKGIIVLGRG